VPEKSHFSIPDIWTDLDTPEGVILSPAPILHPSRRWPKILAGTLAACLGFILIGAGYLYWQAQTVLNEMHAGGKGDIIRSVKSELGIAPSKQFNQTKMSGYFITNADQTALQEEGAQTILLIGSDRRWGETDRGRSDTMLLVRILPHDHMVSVLSIPRDLRVPIPGYGNDKINAAFTYGGERLLVATIREYFGVKIDHFIEVSFRGFGDLITSLGGVYIPVDQKYYVAPNSGFMAINLQPGYQLLQREDALSFVRFRHYDSDFYRASRQQLFLREVSRQVVAARFDLPKMQNLIHAFAKATTTDIGSLGDIWNLMDTIRTTPPDNVQRLTVPGASQMLNGISYVMEDQAAHNRTVAQWYHPEWIIKRQGAITNSIHAHTPHPGQTTSSLSSDSSASSIISQAPKALQTCAPTLRPGNYYWPQGATHSYSLSNHPAFAAYETAGSGRSLLWMYTSWDKAPILADPTKTISRGGKSLELYFENGSLHQVAWKKGRTNIWITNTLKNELSTSQMLDLAISCR
jgi:LCP family protein required for cell wall assembly